MSKIIAKLIVAILFIGYVCADEDPCQDFTEKKNEYQRSVRYTASGSSDDPFRSDRALAPGWYKFSGPNGNEMPTFAPDLESCGTVFPVWMNGSSPQPEEGIVNRTACMVAFGGDNCSVSYNIRVVNCDPEYVYYLVPTDEEESYYCIGEELECPPDYSSENGFTPGCVKGGFPELQNDPDISFGVFIPTNAGAGDLKEVIIKCNIDHHEDTILLDVYWFVGETKVKELVADKAVPLASFPVTLKESEWATNGKGQLDINVTCVFRPRYPNGSIPGDPRQASYYMGFVVKTQTMAVIEGGNIPANYSFRPTIPVLCPVGFEDCELPIDVREPKVNGKPTTCSDGTYRPQTAMISQKSEVDYEVSPCGVTIPETLEPDENTWFHMQVYASTDSQYDGDHDLVLDVRTAESHAYHMIWQGYELPSARVQVIDADTPIVAGQYCHANHDPHMMTFDGRCYENQNEGEFIMYRHTSLPIDVHAYFQNRDNKYTTPCGVAVRAGWDLFIYDQCQGDSEGRVRLYQCDDHVITITELHPQSYKINLPTGGRVEIDTTDGRGKIRVYPSVQDSNSTLGLCGTFSGRCDDDFVLRDGSYLEGDEARADCDREAPEDTCSHNNYEPNSFSNSWRVQEHESLFLGYINDDWRMNDVLYCSCLCLEYDDDECVSGKTVCNRTEELYFCDEGSSAISDSCQERSDSQKLYGSRYSDDVEDEVVMFEYDRNYTSPTPEWSDGWNHSVAQQYCTDFFASITGMDTCKDNKDVDVNTFISFCIKDIQILSDPSSSISHVASALAICENELLHNTSLYTYDNTTGSSSPPMDMLETFCQANCNNQGDCIEGVCHCYEGFLGATCALDSNKVPDIKPLPEDGFCDLQSRPCTKTPIQGDYFIRSPSLVCRLMPTQVTIGGELIPKEAVIVSGQYEHMKRIYCPLNRTTDNENVLTVGYTIQVSNNEMNFSNTVDLAVLNSKCMDCTLDLACTVKEPTCFIEGFCYYNAETKPSGYNKELPSSCYICDPSSDQFAWTLVDSNECSTNAWIIGGSVLLVAALVSVAVVGGIAFKKNKKRAKVEAAMPMSEYSNEQVNIEADAEDSTKLAAEN